MRNLAWIVCLVQSLLFAEALWSGTIPRLGLQTLNGDSFFIPDDLQGRVNVLIIGFSQRAGSNNKPWIDRFERDFASDKSCAIYPVAILTGVPALFRNFAVASIRKGVPADGRARFLTTFQSEKTWQSLVCYIRPDDPYLLVIGSTGNIVGHASGAFEEKAYEEMATAIRLLTSQ